MNEIIDIAIIGGGAAGLMAGISAAEAGGKNIVIFEGNSRCGTKILMSGGSRCNVTNVSVSQDNYFGGSRNFIRNVLRAFNDSSAIEFFKKAGVKLKLEETGKYFPVDDKSATVLEALLTKLHQYGVQIQLNTKISDISNNNGKFILFSTTGKFTARKVILTTGGKSYPATGSDGSGYDLARKLGHKLTNLFPALSPLVLNEAKLSSLSGITLIAKLTLRINGKQVISFEDSLLLTHFGISGPAALNISREFLRLRSQIPSLFINFMPRYEYESLTSLLKEMMKTEPGKFVISFFKEKLPANLCICLFEIAGVETTRKFSSLRKEEIKNLACAFTTYKLDVSGVKGFSKAEATAGGILLEEVRYQSLESKIVKGLYLGGEILDVDGMLGGYNFQWAWSSGFLAGKSAALDK